MVKVTNVTEGNTKTVTWSVSGSVSGTAHISLSNDGGNSWPTTLSTGVVDINPGEELTIDYDDSSTEQEFMPEEMLKL